MSDSWSCLMVEKGPGVLEDDVRDALKKAACQLSLYGIDSMRFSERSCEGVIETSWSSHTVGSRSGILFRSEVDGEKGTYSVNFLLSRRDLENGKEILRRYEAGETMAGWIEGQGRLPVDELYDFRDLSSLRTLQ